MTAMVISCLAGGGGHRTVGLVITTVVMVRGAVGPRIQPGIERQLRDLKDVLGAAQARTRGRGARRPPMHSQCLGLISTF